MANLLGDLWRCGEPDWQGALRLPRVALHLYGKRTPRPGRKMGHLTTLAASAEQAGQRVLAAREALGGAAPGACAAAALASARHRSGEPHAGLFAG